MFPFGEPSFTAARASHVKLYTACSFRGPHAPAAAPEDAPWVVSGLSRGLGDTPECQRDCPSLADLSSSGKESCSSRHRAARWHPQFSRDGPQAVRFLSPHPVTGVWGGSEHPCLLCPCHQVGPLALFTCSRDMRRRVQAWQEGVWGRARTAAGLQPSSPHGRS